MSQHQKANAPYAVPKITAPNLPDPLAERELESAVSDAVRQRLDIDAAHFSGGEADGFSGVAMEFSGCRFERCAFSNWDFKRVSFVDCVFAHCDFSGLRLSNATLRRVRFESCRLTGMEWLGASLADVAFNDCAADYIVFSECKCAHVLFSDCRMRESEWQDVTLKNSALVRCDLTSSRIRGTPLAGMDFTTCTIDSLSIDPYDLRGLKVTAIQGLMFCSLLGLVIEE